ncbi:hypothetical protein Patl1_06852 [Pistacia atlantica]|uniref:Uncharacterized protein n=1 Tax=Pistacia atlantica TaxID=434234 RepID=A0ACC1AEC9_9ROSI|nr:hypothetical protein Patl1_06852 [Pistacia atlantica]
MSCNDGKSILHNANCLNSYTLTYGGYTPTFSVQVKSHYQPEAIRNSVTRVALILVVADSNHKS